MIVSPRPAKLRVLLAVSRSALEIGALGISPHGRQAADLGHGVSRQQSVG